MWTYTNGIPTFLKFPLLLCVLGWGTSRRNQPVGHGWFERARSLLQLSFFGFWILATRRSGNLTSGAAPQMIHTQVDLTRVRGRILRPKLVVRERYPNSCDSTRHLGPTPLDSFGAPLFAQLTVVSLLDIRLSAARKWDKEGRRTVPWEPHSTYHTTCFAEHSARVASACILAWGSAQLGLPERADMS